LALSGREGEAAVTYGCIESGWEFVDPIPKAYFLEHGSELLLGDGMLRAEAEILSQAAAKEHGILANHGELASHRAVTKLAKVSAIEQYRTLWNLVVAAEEFHKCRLASAALAHDSCAGTASKSQIEAVDRLDPVVVLKLKVVELELLFESHKLLMALRDLVGEALQKGGAEFLGRRKLLFKVQGNLLVGSDQRK